MTTHTEQEQTAPDPTTAVLADLCHLRIPSQPNWIGPTVEYLVGRAVSSGAIEPARETKLMIALHEALTNAIIHGNLGISSELKERGDAEYFDAVAARLRDPAHATRVVDVRASYDGLAARWVFHDQGAGFDASAAMSKLDGEPDYLSHSGRGLLLIKAFTDEMRYDDGGRRLALALFREPSEERRKQARLPLGGAVQVTPLNGDGRPCASPRGAFGRNLSGGGLAFVADGDAPAGRVLLTFPGESPFEVMAEVRHWKQLDGDVVEVGCRFGASAEAPIELPTEPAGLSALLGRLAGGTPRHDERRQAMRLPYGGRIEVVLVGGEVLRGFGRDLSRGGVSFTCSGAPPRDVVCLRLSVGEGAPVEVWALVLRCTKLIEGFYDVGARFVSG